MHRWLAYVLLVIAGSCVAADPAGPYARIAVLRPHDGKTIEFEAGYLRHLDWHAGAKDPWNWYGWTVWAGQRQRWFVYATFGRSAAELDDPVSPAEDERDNIANVTPHAEFVGNALYEFLPAASRGTGVPTPTARVEMLTVQVARGAEESFEAALAAHQPKLASETLWFRMVAGGEAPRYVRLRPRDNFVLLLGDATGAALPGKAQRLAVSTVVEILNLRRALSYQLPEVQR